MKYQSGFSQGHVPSPDPYRPPPQYNLLLDIFMPGYREYLETEATIERMREAVHRMSAGFERVERTPSRSIGR